MDTQKAPPMDFKKMNAGVTMIQVENMLADKLRYMKVLNESILALELKTDLLEKKLENLSKSLSAKPAKKGE
jgi:hypothetical protein